MVSNTLNITVKFEYNSYCSLSAARSGQNAQCSVVWHLQFQINFSSPYILLASFISNVLEKTCDLILHEIPMTLSILDTHKKMYSFPSFFFHFSFLLKSLNLTHVIAKFCWFLYSLFSLVMQHMKRFLWRDFIKVSILAVRKDSPRFSRVKMCSLQYNTYRNANSFLKKASWYFLIRKIPPGKSRALKNYSTFPIKAI